MWQAQAQPRRPSRPIETPRQTTPEIYTAPDLLLTNVLLPAMRGHDAAALLRQVRPSMRVLMVAGLPDDHQIYNVTTGDGIEPFPKPFKSQELAAKVKEVLSRKAPAL